MRTRVSLVLVPIDDFTDKIITEKLVNVEINGNNVRQAIRKQEGFFVFTNITQSNVNITIKAYSYNIAKLEVDINKLKKLNPIVKVRLKPNNQYKFPDGITCLSGNTIANTTIKIMYKCKNNLFMLFEDNKEKSSSIRIYNPLNIDLEGKNFIITEKNSKINEEFNIVQFDEEKNLYILNEPLKKLYKKETCEILKIDYIDVFEEGTLFFPLKNFTDDKREIIIQTEDKKKKNINIISGIINDIGVF